MNTLPSLSDLFPFEYVGGGYFRLKNAPKGEKAQILHGEDAIRYLYESMKILLTSTEQSDRIPTK